MSSINAADKSEIAEELEAVLANCEERGTPGTDFVSVLGHRPEIARTFVKNWNATFYEGKVDHRLKELVRLYLAQLHGCEYCQSVGSTLASEQGLSVDKVSALGEHEGDDRFSEQEVAALSFVEDYFDYRHDFDDLHQYFDEPELVELVWFVALQDASQRVATKLDLDATDCAVPVDPSQQAQLDA